MHTYVFTSVNAAYLPKARVLAQSVKIFHPEMKFVLLLAEQEAPDQVRKDPVFDEIICLPQLSIPNFKSWVFKHTVVELCTAIKPFCLEMLLDKPDCDQVIYLDPDIVVFSQLDTVLESLQTASIVLTPHLLDPETRADAVAENELGALKHGVYNLGFIAVRSSAEGKRFANWWKTRLYQFCYDDVPAGVFTDQRWIDLVPAFFEDHRILRDRGCNVAPWNTPQRTISGSVPGDIRVNGGKLKFYHFTGLDSGAHVEMIEHYSQNNKTLLELHDWYHKQCEAVEKNSPKADRWQFDYFTNGDRITKNHRKFLRDQPHLDDVFANPFDTEGSSFLAWFNQESSRTDTERESAAKSAPLFSKLGQLLKR